MRGILLQICQLQHLCYVSGATQHETNEKITQNPSLRRRRVLKVCSKNLFQAVLETYSAACIGEGQNPFAL